MERLGFTKKGVENKAFLLNRRQVYDINKVVSRQNADGPVFQEVQFVAKCLTCNLLHYSTLE
jgi:hypothetical protein